VIVNAEYVVQENMTETTPLQIIDVRTTSPKSDSSTPQVAKTSDQVANSVASSSPSTPNRVTLYSGISLQRFPAYSSQPKLAYAIPVQPLPITSNTSMQPRMKSDVESVFSPIPKQLTTTKPSKPETCSIGKHQTIKLITLNLLFAVFLQLRFLEGEYSLIKHETTLNFLKHILCV